MRPGTSAAVFLGTALLAACGGVPPPRNAITDGRELLGVLGATRGRAKSLRAVGRADHFGREGRVRGTVMFFAERPSRVRFDALTPAQTTAATLTSDGERFALLSTRERRFYTGPALPCNIARLLGIPLSGEDLVEILLGGTPVLKDPSPEVSWDDDGHYVLRLVSPEGLRQEIHVSPDRRRADVLRSVIRDRRGIYVEIEYDDHATVSGVRIAREIHVEMPREDADVLVRYDDVEVNVDLPEDAFQQRAPEGMRAEEVTCP